MAEQSDNPLRGSGFNTDPQTGDWDQLAFENHSLIERVRGENTDTDDAFAIYVQGVSTTTKVFNVLKTGAIWTGSQNTAVLSATAGITLGAVAAAGSGLAALRYDATIKAFQAVTPKPVSSVATYGSSSLASRDDHAHLGVASITASGNTSLYGDVVLYAGSGIILGSSANGIVITASVAPGVTPSAGTPALIWGTTNVVGGTNFIGVSSTVVLYDGTAPASETIGGSAVQGVGSFAARSNHGHAISNLNVTLLGGSWGSGPTLTNPQVAATGWASANHAHLAGNSGGTLAAAAISATTMILGAVATASGAGQWVTGPALGLAAGTWYVSGQITVDGHGGDYTNARIYDGATTYASGEEISPAAPSSLTFTLGALVALVGSATVVLQANMTPANGIVSIVTSHHPVGNNASQITAIKLA